MWNRFLAAGVFALTIQSPLPADDLSGWSSTKLSYFDLTQELTNETCNKTVQDFYGCASASNLLLRFGKTSRILGPERVLANVSKGSQKIEKDFGILKIGKPGNSNFFEEQPGMLLSDIKNRKTRRFEIYRRAYQEKGSDIVDFESIFQWIQSIVPKLHTDLEKSIVGESLNAYYGIAIDPHAHLVPEESMTRFLNGALENRKAVGIGVKLIYLPKSIIVSGLLDDGPAMRAGLKSEDEIVSIDGQQLNDKSIPERQALFTGPEGTTMTFKVLRRGLPLTITVTREAIVFENITTTLIPSSAPELIKIKVNSFDGAACRDFERKKNEALEEITKLHSRLKGIILDLRNNPGGDSEAARCITSKFLAFKEKIWTIKSTQSSAVLSEAFSTELTPLRLPLVIIINGASASASEITAGVLQFYGNLVVGEPSSGKGSVQVVDQEFSKRHPNVRALLYKTSGLYHFPSGITPQITGVIPDISISSDELSSLREEDLFEMPLPAVGRRWIQPRPRLISEIKTCVESSGEAKKVWNRSSSDPLLRDYQLLYAIDAIRCLPGFKDFRGVVGRHQIRW